MAEPLNKLHRDWYLNSSRAKPLVGQPDRFYIDFIYNALHNHLYHIDIDCILFDMKTLEPVAVMEQINGLGREITPFKKERYINLAKRLGVPFYIVNWDGYENKATVTNGLTGSVKLQTLFEHKKWLRSIKESHPRRRVWS
jgi:hypothetical protein